MPTDYKKQFIWGVGIFAFIFLTANVFFISANNLVSNISFSNTAAVLTAVEPEVIIKVPTEPKIQLKNIKLAFVGDIMLDRGVKNSVYKNFGGDYSELFDEVRDQLRGYDILTANLEGPISYGGKDGGGDYSFRFEPRVVPVLKDAGFDVLSVSNNHSFNWGREAFTDTLQLLADAGIAYVGGGFNGNDAYQEKIIDVNGIKIAFLSFSEIRDGGVGIASSKAGIAVISEEEVKNSISKAKTAADLVVVSYHFGEEYENTPNKYQKKYAELAVDSGADLVVGHHPHVVQTLEQYKNTYIIYSLGNFIFDQYFSDETMQGGLLEVEINAETKQIEKVQLKKVSLNTKFQVESIN